MQPSGAIAVLRRCRKCNQYRSVEAFVGAGKLCQRCIRGKDATGYIAHSRGIVLTPKGREAIKEVA